MSDTKDYFVQRHLGYDDTIKEDFIVRMTLKHGDDVNDQLPIKMQTRSVTWGESDERSYEFGLSKYDNMEDAWEMFEDCVANQSMCGKPEGSVGHWFQDDELKEIEVGRIHHDHSKWVCYTRERTKTGDNQERRTSQIKSYDELNTLDEALETLSGKL